MERAVTWDGTAPRNARDRRPDFERLLGTASWNALPAAVRARFKHSATACADTVVYAGRMEARASLAGRIAAQLCRLIGTPVAPRVGRDVPVRVRVFDHPDGEGTVWERVYDFPGERVLVSSTKQVDERGVLIEALGAGLRMQLDLEQRDGALHFISRCYYFEWGGWRIPLPLYLTPGRTRVVHEDLSNGRFRFSMHTVHPWWGEVYYQCGEFRREDAI